MKIKFSGIGVVDGRGKLNGTVFSRNRSGAIARVKVTPINPNTAAQLLLEVFWQAFLKDGAACRKAAILQWNNAVSDYQTTDVFGDLRRQQGKTFTRN
jgi:hypothetical protein